MPHEAHRTRRMVVRRAGLIVLRVFFFLPVLGALVMSLTDFDLYALSDFDNLRFIGFENYRAAAAASRCSGRRSATRSTSSCSACRCRSVLSLGAALLVNSKRGALPQPVPHGLLRAGGHDAGRRRGRVALHLSHALRLSELHARVDRASIRSTGWAIRTGRCRRS